MSNRSDHLLNLNNPPSKHDAVGKCQPFWRSSRTIPTTYRSPFYRRVEATLAYKKATTGLSDRGSSRRRHSASRSGPDVSSSQQSGDPADLEANVFRHHRERLKGNQHSIRQAVAPSVEAPDGQSVQVLLYDLARKIEKAHLSGESKLERNAIQAIVYKIADVTLPEPSHVTDIEQDEAQEREIISETFARENASDAWEETNGPAEDERSASVSEQQTPSPSQPLSTIQPNAGVRRNCQLFLAYGGLEILFRLLQCPIEMFDEDAAAVAHLRNDVLNLIKEYLILSAKIASACKYMEPLFHRLIELLFVPASFGFAESVAEELMSVQEICADIGRLPSLPALFASMAPRQLSLFCRLLYLLLFEVEGPSSCEKDLEQFKYAGGYRFPRAILPTNASRRTRQPRGSRQRKPKVFRSYRRSPQVFSPRADYLRVSSAVTFRSHRFRSSDSSKPDACTCDSSEVAEGGLFHSTSCRFLWKKNHDTLLRVPRLLERLILLLKFQTIPIPLRMAALSCAHLPSTILLDAGLPSVVNINLVQLGVPMQPPTATAESTHQSDSTVAQPSTPPNPSEAPEVSQAATEWAASMFRLVSPAQPLSVASESAGAPSSFSLSSTSLLSPPPADSPPQPEAVGEPTGTVDPSSRNEGGLFDAAAGRVMTSVEMSILEGGSTNAEVSTEVSMTHRHRSSSHTASSNGDRTSRSLPEPLPSRPGRRPFSTIRGFSRGVSQFFESLLQRIVRPLPSFSFVQSLRRLASAVVPSRMLRLTAEEGNNSNAEQRVVPATPVASGTPNFSADFLRRTFFPGFGGPVNVIGPTGWEQLFQQVSGGLNPSLPALPPGAFDGPGGVTVVSHNGTTLPTGDGMVPFAVGALLDSTFATAEDGQRDRLMESYQILRVFLSSDTESAVSPIPMEPPSNLRRLGKPFVDLRRRWAIANQRHQKKLNQKETHLREVRHLLKFVFLLTEEKDEDSGGSLEEPAGRQILWNRLLQICSDYKQEVPTGDSGITHIRNLMSEFFAVRGASGSAVVSKDAAAATAAQAQSESALQEQCKDESAEKGIAATGEEDTPLSVPKSPELMRSDSEQVSASPLPANRMDQFVKHVEQRPPIGSGWGAESNGSESSGSDCEEENSMSYSALMYLDDESEDWGVYSSESEDDELDFHTHRHHRFCMHDSTDEMDTSEEGSDECFDHDDWIDDHCCCSSDETSMSGSNSSSAHSSNPAADTEHRCSHDSQANAQHEGQMEAGLLDASVETEGNERESSGVGCPNVEAPAPEMASLMVPEGSAGSERRPVAVWSSSSSQPVSFVSWTDDFAGCDDQRPEEGLDRDVPEELPMMEAFSADEDLRDHATEQELTDLELEIGSALQSATEVICCEESVEEELEISSVHPDACAPAILAQEFLVDPSSHGNSPSRAEISPTPIATPRSEPATAEPAPPEDVGHPPNSVQRNFDITPPLGPLVFPTEPSIPNVDGTANVGGLHTVASLRPEQTRQLLHPLVQAITNVPDLSSEEASFFFDAAQLGQQQAELHFVLMALLNGHRALYVHRRLVRLGIIPILTKLFDTLVWFGGETVVVPWVALPTALETSEFPSLTSSENVLEEGEKPSLWMHTLQMNESSLADGLFWRPGGYYHGLHETEVDAVCHNLAIGCPDASTTMSSIAMLCQLLRPEFCGDRRIQKQPPAPPAMHPIFNLFNNNQSGGDTPEERQRKSAAVVCERSFCNATLEFLRLLNFLVDFESPGVSRVAKYQMLSKHEWIQILHCGSVGHTLRYPPLLARQNDQVMALHLSPELSRSQHAQRPTEPSASEPPGLEEVAEEAPTGTNGNRLGDATTTANASEQPKEAYKNARRFQFTHDAGLLMKLMVLYAEESPKSFYKYSLSSALQSTLRGADVDVQVFVIKAGLLEVVLRDILAKTDNGCDLLAEAVRFNLVGLYRLNILLMQNPTVFKEFCKILTEDVVTSNVLFRSLLLTSEFARQISDAQMLIEGLSEKQSKDSIFLPWTSFHFPRHLSARSVGISSETSLAKQKAALSDSSESDDVEPCELRLCPNRLRCFRDRRLRWCGSPPGFTLPFTGGKSLNRRDNALSLLDKLEQRRLKRLGHCTLEGRGKRPVPNIARLSHFARCTSVPSRYRLDTWNILPSMVTDVKRTTYPVPDPLYDSEGYRRWRKPMRQGCLKPPNLSRLRPTEFSCEWRRWTTPIDAVLENQRYAILIRLLCALPYTKVSHNNICCLNSTLVILMLAYLDGHLPDLLERLKWDLFHLEALFEEASVGGQASNVSPPASIGIDGSMPCTDDEMPSPSDTEPTCSMSSNQHVLEAKCHDEAKQGVVEFAANTGKPSTTLPLAMEFAPSDALAPGDFLGGDVSEDSSALVAPRKPTLPADAHFSDSTDAGSEDGPLDELLADHLPAFERLPRCEQLHSFDFCSVDSPVTLTEPSSIAVSLEMVKDGSPSQEADITTEPASEIPAALQFLEPLFDCSDIPSKRTERKLLPRALFNLRCLLWLWYARYSKGTKYSRELEFSCQIPLDYWRELVGKLCGSARSLNSISHVPTFLKEDFPKAD